MSVLVGPLALVKPADAITVLPILAMLIIRTRSLRLISWAAVAGTASAACAWALTGQSFGNVGAWITGSAHLTSGYADAMASDVPSLLGEVAATVAAAVLLTLAIRGRAATRPTRPVLVALLVTTVLFAKQGFTRQDAYHEAELLVGLLVLALTVGSFADTAIVGALASLLLVWAIVADGVAYPAPLRPGTGPFGAIMTLKPEHREDLLRESRERLMREYALSTRLRKQVGDSPVAIDPFEVAVAWAYKLNWTPVPIFQTYSAYDNQLDAENTNTLLAHHISVLREEARIDRQFPLWTSPRYNLAITCHYDETAHDGRWALFRPSGNHCGVPSRAGTEKVIAGHSIRIPEHSSSQIVTMSYSRTGVTLVQRLTWAIYKNEGGDGFWIGHNLFRISPRASSGPLIVALPPTIRWPMDPRWRPSSRIISTSSGVAHFQVIDFVPSATRR